jgi:carbonic anhydrase
MISAVDGLESLRQGNRRFVADSLSRGAGGLHARRTEVATGQEPFAVILGCSDSRVPVELVFDHGLGDLFVIRVVGNIVVPSSIGSVEFAAQHFGTRLVVVLGHSRCGAVRAALDEGPPAADQSHHLDAIVEMVRASIDEGTDNALLGDPDDRLARAVRANIRSAVRQLRHGSGVIERLEREDGLVVVGAEYSLESGVVDFFDRPSGID